MLLLFGFSRDFTNPCSSLEVSVVQVVVLSFSSAGERFSIDSLISQWLKARRRKLKKENKHKASFIFQTLLWLYTKQRDRHLGFSLSLLLLRAQVVIVYFYAAFWKLSPAWLCGDALRATLTKNSRVGFTKWNHSGSKGSYFDGYLDANQAWARADVLVM